MSEAAGFLNALADNPSEAESLYDQLGRPNYVAADFAKELVPGWECRENRAALEDLVYEPAARLARQLFRRKSGRLPHGSRVVLITGPVAAGKTSSVPKQLQLVYEVGLSNFEHARELLEAPLQLGLKPHIVYLYSTPKVSAARRAIRMIEEGRPANIAHRGSIVRHLALPISICRLVEEYGHCVPVRIWDNSFTGDPPRELPIAKIDRLYYQRSEADLIREQQEELDQLYAAGEIPAGVYIANSASPGPQPTLQPGLQTAHLPFAPSACALSNAGDTVALSAKLSSLMTRSESEDYVPPEPSAEVAEWSVRLRHMTDQEADNEIAQEVYRNLAATALNYREKHPQKVKHPEGHEKE